MSRVVARPNQLDLDSPGRRDYWLALEHDSIWGDHLIPLTVIGAGDRTATVAATGEDGLVMLTAPVSTA